MARILVIDDEELVRLTLQDVLASNGHNVSVANNGEQGVAMQADKPFDLIITDILMPAKEGMETIIELRQSWPNLKIIAISGGGKDLTPNYLERAQQLGATDVLTKPFTEAEIIETVNSCLSLNN